MTRRISQIDNTTAEFQKLFGSLTNEELNRKPNPTTWSIAQNIDHLIVINSTYFPIIEKIKAGRYKPPFLAKFGFVTSFFGKLLLNAVQPDRKKRTKTFPIWEPAESQIPDNILERFTKHQTELKQLIETSEELIKKGVVISSPANKNIVYKLETAFDIIITHEQRHLEQSKEVLKRMTL